MPFLLSRSLSLSLSITHAQSGTAAILRASPSAPEEKGYDLKGLFSPFFFQTPQKCFLRFSSSGHTFKSCNVPRGQQTPLPPPPLPLPPLANRLEDFSHHVRSSLEGSSYSAWFHLHVDCCFFQIQSHSVILQRAPQKHQQHSYHFFLKAK